MPVTDANGQPTRWETDADTGIQKQIVTDYAQSTELPGSTVIPSHRGRHGAQAGRKERGPIPMIVDPDRDDGGIVIMPGMLDNKDDVISASQGGDASAAFAQLAHKEDEVATRKSTKTPKKTAAAKPAVAKRVPQPATAPAPTAPADEPEAVIDERVPEFDIGAVRDAIAADVIGALLPELRSMLADAAAPARLDPAVYVPSVVDEVPQEDSPEDPVGAEPQPEAPKIQVLLTSPDGSKMAVRYHHVLDTNDDIVVFIYDTRFEHGDRVYPKPNLEAPYVVEVKKGGEVQMRCTAVYMGIAFTFQGFEFQVLVKSPTPDQE